MSVAIGTLVDVKKIFFDREKIINATDKATRKALGNIGGYVRKVARNSIQKGKRPSPPGQPPHSHVGLLKQGILYGYDADSKSVVVGPTLLRSRSKYGDTLEMIEYGGTTNRKGKPARYRARPFMEPAKEKSAPFDRFWKDSVI
jgi:hypothetical protein